MAEKKPTVVELAARISALEGKPKEHPSRRRFSIKRNLVLIVAILGVWVTYYGWWEPHAENVLQQKIDSRFDAKLKESGIHEQLDKINDKVTAIQSSLATLQPFIEDLIHRQLSGMASLSAPAFRQKLPELGNALDVALEQKIASNDAVPLIADKLASEKDRPSAYWHAAGSLISYRSRSFIVPSFMPDCTDKPPTPMTVLKVQDEKHLTAESGHYRNCKITLDSDQDRVRLTTYMEAQTPLIEFDNCLVIYKGGPINLILEWHDHQGNLSVGGAQPQTVVSISGNALTFKECQFSFDIRGTPPENAATVVHSVLAQRDSVIKALPITTVTKPA